MRLNLKSSQETRQQLEVSNAVKADADLMLLLKATPAQIDTWVDNNVKTLAEAQQLFKKILKVMAVVARL